LIMLRRQTNCLFWLQFDVFLLLQQNAALFWYNYEVTGSIDASALHAGCPVLMGEKWSMFI